MSRKALFVFGTAALVGLVGCGDDSDPMTPGDPTSFTLTIRNISAATVNLEGVAGAAQAGTPLAPGVWAVTDSGTPLFDAGQPDRGEGLEALAEDGNNAPLASTLENRSGVAASGTFGSGPIGPGGSYTATFEADPGQRLSFATMYVQSNDIVFAPGMEGISLFNGDEPVTGDITTQVALYDAGTEINQEPGVGANQAPRQSGPNQGPTEGLVQAVNDGFVYPATSAVVNATISAATVGSETTFTVRIDNLAASGGPYPLAPGAWAVHGGSNPLFTPGTTDPGQGLEALAEDGNNATLVGNLPAMSGVAASGSFGSGPQGPDGEVYEFSFTAQPGQKLSLATMFVQSNDLFYAPAVDGIDLFPGGQALGSGGSVDITGSLALWDAGTEINEAPGVGMYQAPRQAAANTGPAEGVVQQVMDGFTYGNVPVLIEVTLTAN